MDPGTLTYSGASACTGTALVLRSSPHLNQHPTQTKMIQHGGTDVQESGCLNEFSALEERIGI